MVTKSEVSELVASGESYESAAARLGIPAGLAYLVATGLPADGSDSLSPEQMKARTGPGRPPLLSSPQRLSNPPQVRASRADEVASFLRARAAADGPMRDAARRRTGAPPDEVLPEDEAGRIGIANVLEREHNQVRYILEELEAVPPFSRTRTRVHASRRRSLVDMIAERLAGHEAAEEQVFWPAVSSLLAELGGPGLAEKATADEEAARRTLSHFEGLEGTEGRFDELVEQLAAQLRKHVAFEDLVLLKLSSQLDEAAQVRLGAAFVDARGRAPTRPRPGGGGGARGDRLRDAVGGRPARREGRADSEDPREQG